MDIAHEWGGHHFRRKHMKALFAFEANGTRKNKEKRMRDFYVDDIQRLIVEEGVANFVVYSEASFEYESKVPARFKSRFAQLLSVENPAQHVLNYLSRDTHWDDGSG